MNTYCHIEEFGRNRYGLIPIMLLCFETSTIWAPDGAEIYREYQANKDLVISPGDFLDFIYRGLIKVMARKDWFYRNSGHSKNSWQVSNWLPGFDNELRELAERDSSEPFSQRRVIMADEELGNDRAKYILGQGRKYEANKDLIEHIYKLIEDKNLPDRIIKRINERKSIEDKVHFVLRSAINNHNAFLSSKANLPLVSDKPDIYLYYINKKLTKSQREEINKIEVIYNDTLIREDHTLDLYILREYINFLTLIDRPRNIAEVKRMLNSEQRTMLAKQDLLLLKSSSNRNIDDSVIALLRKDLITVDAERALTFKDIHDLIYPLFIATLNFVSGIFKTISARGISGGEFVSVIDDSLSFNSAVKKITGKNRMQTNLKLPYLFSSHINPTVTEAEEIARLYIQTYKKHKAN